MNAKGFTPFFVIIPDIVEIDSIAQNLSIYDKTKILEKLHILYCRSITHLLLFQPSLHQIFCRKSWRNLVKFCPPIVGLSVPNIGHFVDTKQGDKYKFALFFHAIDTH